MILKEINPNTIEKSPAEVSFNRTQCSFENLSEKFKCRTRDFSNQFAHIYAGRLNLLKPRILKVAKEKWGMHLINILFTYFLFQKSTKQ